MLQLYFYPMACSLASRIALMEAGAEARYHLVNIWNKTIPEDDRDFWTVSPKGGVPVLVLEDGEHLTENAAVLQYIADLRPGLGLAPPPGDPDRYRLQEWLSFVGTEIHKAFLFPTFWYKDEAAKASARERIGQNVSVAAEHLADRPYLVGERFTIIAPDDYRHDLLEIALFDARGRELARESLYAADEEEHRQMAISDPFESLAHLLAFPGVPCRGHPGRRAYAAPSCTSASSRPAWPTPTISFDWRSPFPAPRNIRTSTASPSRRASPSPPSRPTGAQPTSSSARTSRR